MDKLRTITVEELAEVIGRKASTIRADIHRRPSTLPPRLRIPGSTRLLWLESDVRSWLEQCRADLA